MSGILRITCFCTIILALFLPSVLMKSRWQRTGYMDIVSRQKHCDSKPWSKECSFRKLHKPLSILDSFRYFFSHSNKEDKGSKSIILTASTAAPTPTKKVTYLHQGYSMTSLPPWSERQERIIKQNLFRLENEPCGASYTNKLKDEWWTAPGEYPWLALLLYQPIGQPDSQLQNLCGGSLITDRYVLTSAYCLEMPEYELNVVRLGEFNVEFFEKDCTDLEQNIFDIISFEACSTIPPVDYDYSELIVHPSYVYNDDAICGKHDIALIRLAERVIFTKLIHPICLPVGNMKSLWNPNDVGANFTIVGWGMMNVVPVRTIASLKERKLCSDSLKKDLLEGQFCVESEDSNSCHGDIGGPAITSTVLKSSDNATMRLTKSVQVGVLSSIFCNYSTPLFFTSVETYLPWILETMDP